MGLEEGTTEEDVVSTLAVEWIEIPGRLQTCFRNKVSTLAVEWIEILLSLIAHL